MYADPYFCLSVFDEWEVPRENVKILEEIGQGSFGSVYRGILLLDNEPDKQVAIKVSRRQGCSWVFRPRVLHSNTSLLLSILFPRSFPPPLPILSHPPSPFLPILFNRFPLSPTPSLSPLGNATSPWKKEVGLRVRILPLLHVPNHCSASGFHDNTQLALVSRTGL